jgi:hypothetical protein
MASILVVGGIVSSVNHLLGFAAVSLFAIDQMLG